VFPSSGRGSAAEDPTHPFNGIPNRLWCGYNVKWWWTGATLLEIAYPELRASKLPLHISTFLGKSTESLLIKRFIKKP